jgi:hypothetical protein
MRRGNARKSAQRRSSIGNALGNDGSIGIFSATEEGCEENSLLALPHRLTGNGPAHGCRKSTSVQPTFSIHTLSLRGADNPSSRNHPLRVSPRKGSNQVPYKTEKALISEPIFSRPKKYSIQMCISWRVTGVVYIKRSFLRPRPALTNHHMWAALRDGGS